MSGVSAGERILGRHVRNVGADGKTHEYIVLAVFMASDSFTPELLVESAECSGTGWSKIFVVHSGECEVLE